MCWDDFIVLLVSMYGHYGINAAQAEEALMAWERGVPLGTPLDQAAREEVRDVMIDMFGLEC